MPKEVGKGGRDAAIAGIAGRQHGVITTRQLYAVGVSVGAVAGRVRVGRLHRIHRGVYAVGHGALSTEGSWMAAVLACAAGTVLSHRSAGYLWGILRRDPSVGSEGGRGPGETEVTVRSGERVRRPGILGIGLAPFPQTM
jgi:Transcriptional regulator, AbiEi antitoxin